MTSILQSVFHGTRVSGGASWEESSGLKCVDTLDTRMLTLAFRGDAQEPAKGSQPSPGKGDWVRHISQTYSNFTFLI